MKTRRGHELAYSNRYLDTHPPVVCVEFYSKWYSVYIVFPDRANNDRPGAIVEYAYPHDCPDGESPFLDHVPNPKAIAKFAQEHGCLIDPLSWELMVGRWEIEYHNRYQSEQVTG